jgi:hypothetical protein
VERSQAKREGLEIRKRGIQEVKRLKKGVYKGG